MYPNLLGLKSYYHLTNEEMGRIIGVSRIVYGRKIRNGNFLSDECRAYCKYFNKSFDYLFATEDDTLQISSGCRDGISVKSMSETA